MTTDAWRRQFPNAELHDVIDAVVDLIATRCAEKMAAGERPAVEKMGYSPKEAADYLGCSERHVRTMIDSGQIRAGQLGSRVIVHRSELDRVMLGEAVAS